MTSERNILLLGASGVLGRALARALGERVAAATYLSHPLEGGVRFDARSSSVRELLAHARKPAQAAVILLGETKIDRCAEKPDETAQTNVAGVARVARELAEARVMPVFVSSDAVFDGSRAHWTEADAPNPILTYGRQKLEAERAVASLRTPWLIVRLPKLLSPMVEDWVDALSRPREIQCAVDQHFTPMSSRDAAAALVALIDQAVQGLVHVCGPERLSRRALLDAVLDEYRRHAQPAATIVERGMRDIERMQALREPRPLDTSMRSIRVPASAMPASQAARELVRERLAR